VASHRNTNAASLQLFLGGQPCTPEETSNASLFTEQHLVGVFFDIEKVYDTAWRYGILETLDHWQSKGQLPVFS
jgi:hypothetical protein